MPPSCQVRAVIGHTYMLTQDEELWAKELPANVEALLASTRDPLADRSDRGRPAETSPRDKTRVVSYRVPHNAAVQVYDYREKKARWGSGAAVTHVEEDGLLTAVIWSSGWCSDQRW